jgi:pyridoxine/pyridoxamine 5'-phosphate oxidase
MTQFARWMATHWPPQPEADGDGAVHHTAGPGRGPAPVLLKAHDQAGFTFYSNRTSRKREDCREPAACLVFPVVSASTRR